MTRYLTILSTAALLCAIVEPATAQKFLQRTAAEWTGQLKSPDASLRRNAAFALGKMGSVAEDALPALKQALRKEQDNRAREAMVCAAGEIGTGTLTDDKELEAMLIQAARDSDKLVRRSAVYSLGLIAGKSDATRAALANALSDAEQIVRQNAAWALGQLDAKAAPSLVQVLADATSDSLVKRDAANALFTVGRGNPDLIRPALNHLLNMCRDPDAEVRKAGLVPLVKVVTKDDTLALSILKKVLSDADPEVKRYAALALSNVGGDEAVDAVPILRDTLRNGEPHLKRSAAVALHNIGPAAAPAVPDLLKALQDPDPDLRTSAALALGGIGKGAESAVAPLVQLVANTTQPKEVRIEAAEALTQIALTTMGNVPAMRQRIPEVLKVLGDSNEDGNLRVRLAWLFNSFIQHDPTMNAAFPVFDKICAERDSKMNGSTRYHCAYLLGIRYGAKAPDSALNVLGEWLFDNTGKLYEGQSSSVDAQGFELKGGQKVKAKLIGDSRVMAVASLRQIGAERVRARKDIVNQVGVLLNDKNTHENLKIELNKLLTQLGK